MKQLLFLCLLIFSLSSCSKKVYFQDAAPADDQAFFHEDPEISINTYYAGDAVDYIIFEISVVNKSDQAIYLENEKVSLDPLGERGRPYPALTREEIISDLYSYKEQAKKQRRQRNIDAAVGVGLNVLTAVAFRTPDQTINAIINSTDAAAYAFEGNRAYALIEGTLEEQVNYVNESVLDYAKILPGEEQNWDLLFEPSMMDDMCKLQIECMGKTYEFEYELFINEMKL